MKLGDTYVYNIMCDNLFKYIENAFDKIRIYYEWLSIISQTECDYEIWFIWVVKGVGRDMLSRTAGKQSI